MKNKISSLKILVLSGLLSVSSLAHANALRCENVFDPITVNGSPKAALNKLSYREKIEIDHNGMAFAKGSTKTAGKEMQFGFESEYMISELGLITNFYGPSAEAGIAKAAWLALPVAERLQWIEAKSKSIPFGSKDAVIVRLDKDPQLDFLPNQLIRDDTGNVEIVLAPVNRFDTWLEQVRWINKNFGVGSMQSMISQPKETFFATTSPMSEVSLKENKGYENFIHEADVLSRMAAGAEKFAKDPTKEVLRPFLHPYLGPMVKFRHKKLMETLTEVAQGKVLNAEETAAIIKLEHSFKYIGSTSYRPDIAGATRASHEVRDAHKDEALLIDRTARAVYFAQKGRGGFIGLSNAKPLDTVVDFEKFDVKTQNFLKAVFPVKSPKAFEFEKARLVHETFRNFAYPLKEWRPLLQGIDRMDLNKTVNQAQQNYVQRLAELEIQFSQGRITAEAARAEVEGALANFAVESRLHDAMVKFQEKVKTQGNDIAAGLIAPRRSLELRIAEFSKKWDGHVQSIPGVTFKYKDGVQKTNTDRDLLMISTQGLNAGQIKQIEKDFLDMVAIQNLTFPLKERATHTLVNFDGISYNFGYAPIQAFPRFRIKDYHAPSSRRIEPIILLNRFEERNLQTYIANVKADKKAVLGKFNLEGDPKTNGKIDNNQSACGNNCTTWITRAPIGKNNEALIDLLGGEVSVPWVQQNPGWFGSWVTGTASQERVPVTVLWTPKTITEALKTEFQDGALIWDFNRK